MTKPPAATSRPRKRSRLFQAAPDALFVEEWVPNITLPPPPDAPLEEEEGVVQLDEHGLPEREEEEEPEPERRGPARIYVGKGASADAGAKPEAGSGISRDEMPPADVELPALSLPSQGDDEDDSDPSMPDLSIDGTGSNWGAVFDGLDDEDPTDPELHSGAESEGGSSEPMPMPAAGSPDDPPALAQPPAPEPVQSPPPPRLDRPGPAAALDARSTPTWSRPSKPVGQAKPATPARLEPPRIRATQPKPPEPGLGSLVPRSLIIAFIVLAILVVVVWAIRHQNADLSEQPGPGPAGPPATPELTIQPGTMDLGSPPPAPAREPVQPEPVQPASAAAKPAPAPAAASAPRPSTPVAAPAPAPVSARPQPAASPPASARTAPPPAAEPPVAEPTGKGFMVVESDRYAMIYMGGRRLGGTPIARLELEPGSYAVRAVCRDTGATKTAQIEIKAGELATASFRFMP